MANKVFLVTGSTSGVGRAASEALAALGDTVVMVARDPVKAQRAQEEIVGSTSNEDVHVLLADLASQKQIRTLAADFKDRFDRLDALVNNAGLIVGEHRLTEDGIEETFAVNHLAPFLLTNLLLDTLKASAPSRVVTVASVAHVMGRIDFDDLKGESSEAGQRAYNASKLANVMFTYELARRLEGTGVTATCVHPGAVATNYGADGPLLTRIVVPLAKPFLRSPAQGADTVVWLAASREAEGVTGKYFWSRKARRTRASSNDVAAQRKLWDESARLVGLA